MTLYRNFASKDELIVAFLAAREERWTRGWLQAEVERRAPTPRERLLAIFDVFGEWFALPDFEGCSFINVMLELTDRADPGRVASVQHLSVIREFLAGLAAEAGVDGPGGVRAPVAHPDEGLDRRRRRGRRRAAAARAQELGALLLAARVCADSLLRERDRSVSLTAREESAWPFPPSWSDRCRGR